MSSESPSKSHSVENSIPENSELETPLKNFIDHLNEHHLDLLPHKRTRTLSEYLIFIFDFIYFISI